MKKHKTFFRKCPTRGCKAISGFYLTEEQIKQNEKYFCQECTKENKLSKWKHSSERDYIKRLQKMQSSIKVRLK